VVSISASELVSATAAPARQFADQALMMRRSILRKSVLCPEQGGAAFVTPYCRYRCCVYGVK
jgi:hypothetical protein